MNCFSTFPRVSKSLVGRGADVTGNQAVHCFGNNIRSGLACSSDLRYLGVPDALLIRVDLKGSKHVNLLNQQKRCVLLSQFLGNLGKQASGVSIFIGFSVQFDRLHLLVILNQHLRITLEQLLNLHEVILLSQLNRIVPLVKQHAAVYRAFHVAKLHIGIYCILAQAHGLELFADRLQHRGVWWDLVD